MNNVQYLSFGGRVRFATTVSVSAWSGWLFSRFKRPVRSTAGSCGFPGRLRGALHRCSTDLQVRRDWGSSRCQVVLLACVVSRGSVGVPDQESSCRRVLGLPDVRRGTASTSFHGEQETSLSTPPWIFFFLLASALAVAAVIWATVRATGRKW